MIVEYLRDDHYLVVGGFETASGGKPTSPDVRYHRIGVFDNSPFQ